MLEHHGDVDDIECTVGIHIASRQLLLGRFDLPKNYLKPHSRIQNIHLSIVVQVATDLGHCDFRSVDTGIVRIIGHSQTYNENP